MGLLRSLAVHCLLLTAIGVGTWYVARPPQRPCLPAYECVVPSRIPATKTFVNDAGKTETWDTLAEYRHAHRQGWDECLAQFVHNRCGRRLRHRASFSDLDIPFPQQSWFSQEGRNDGYAACIRALKIEPHFGRSVVPDPNWDDQWFFGGYRFAHD